MTAPAQVGSGSSATGNVSAGVGGQVTGRARQRPRRLPGLPVGREAHLRLEDLPVGELPVPIARKDHARDRCRRGQFDLRPLFALRGRDPTVVVAVEAVVEVRHGMDGVAGEEGRRAGHGAAAGQGEVGG